ncbi:MAG: NAD(P)-dependent oxidoreductase [Saprospiraceae bacterium]
MLKIGIIREGKVPPDSRVPLTPKQCAWINANHPVQIKVQTSPSRCYKDEAYAAEGIEVVEDVSDCEVLLGVKEVPIEQLIAAKKYFFFSHTIKKQAYNRALLLAILEKNIRIFDYEVLTNESGERLIAFGIFAGMVGAHNGLWTYGQRTGEFELKRMKDYYDYAEAVQAYQQITLPPLKIVLTGGGRVASGSASVLEDMGVRKVSPNDYLTNDFEEAVFTQLNCEDYVKHQAGKTYDRQHFFNHPQEYVSNFEAYTKKSDLFINGIYWDNQAPAFFSAEEMKAEDFRIKVIADVTCDIAPVSSIPSTLRASTIADPVFGYDPLTGAEVPPFQQSYIDMMTIDNLPNELPRDASKAFGEQFITSILEEVLNMKDSAVMQRATVAIDGKLGPHFGYLEDYVVGE